MNSDQIQGQWKQVEGEGKRLWGKLTDDDWTAASGDVKKLSGRLQERYGDAKEKVGAELTALMRRISSGVEKGAAAAAKAAT